MEWGRYPDPFEEFVRRVHREMQKLFEEVEREFMRFVPHDFDRIRVREPLVDIFKDKEGLIITAELPGVRKEDINLRFLDKRRLHILVESKKENEKQLENAIHIERAYNRFERVVYLPYPVKPETAKARFNNGVLEVKVKLDEKEVKKIEGVPVKVE